MRQIRRSALPLVGLAVVVLYLVLANYLNFLGVAPLPLGELGSTTLIALLFLEVALVGLYVARLKHHGKALA